MRNGNVFRTMLRLSIIVPVYNVEQYIKKCLISCLDQDLDKSEYEIIVVDDGSKDKSAEIVKDIAQNTSNIILIHQKNGGLSSARNTGLAMAKGEYVWFVDSDDWIKSNCLKYLTNTVCKNDLDVLCFGVDYYHTPTHIDSSMSPTTQDGVVMSGEDFITKVHMIPAAWVALYRRKFLICNNLRFLEGILHEDQEFTPRAYCLAHRIMYVHRHEYVYLQRQGSIMKSNRNAQRCLDLLTIADSLYAFTMRYLQKNSAARASMFQRINFIFCQSLIYYNKKILSLSDYEKKPYYPLFTQGLPCKLAFKYKLANISLKLYLIIYKLK